MKLTQRETAMSYPENYEDIKSGLSRREILRNRIASHDRAAERAMAELDRLESLPQEPDNDPAIIFFKKSFDRNLTGSRPPQIAGKLYDYAAIKAGDGLWYTTGPRSKGGYTWEELCEFLARGVEEVWIVTELERLIG